MQELPSVSCSCQGSAPRRPAGGGLGRQLMLGLPLAVAWWALYQALAPVAHFLTYRVLGLAEGGAPGAAVEFFLYDTPKVLILLVLVVFVVGVIRSFFTPARTRVLLAGRRESLGNLLAACLGIVTPFCSCSAVPLFIGFVSAGVPLGVTFSFLISAPMVNEVALVLLYGLFGWKVAAIYLATGLGIAMLAGWVIGRLGMEDHIEGWVRETRAAGALPLEDRLAWSGRLRQGGQAVRDIVGKVWPYVVAGIAVGALIHGYVPENFLAALMGKEAWWAVPSAVLLGIPLYSNAAGMIPVVQALMGKGAALGTVLAFMMAVIALSLPEMMILRKVLKPRLIVVFAGTVGLGIVLVGYLFNWLV